MERMTYIPEESKVIYQSKDGKEEKILDALDWLAARIHYFSEIWGATTKGKKFFQGEQVKVVGMDGLMLVVEGVLKDQNII